MSDVFMIGRRDIEFNRDPIGHGGYSTVYKGKWNTTPVAIKRLNRPDTNELQILSKLKHPNIASLHGVVDQRPDFFLVLELCDGGSLRDYLNKKSNIPVHELLCLSWGEQAAKAIEYLQQCHVIHRDVKSSNYLITNLKSKNLKLCDFGISKTSAKTVTTEVKGTWGWTAPEVFSEEHISPKSDIFSYATVLWEILTGKIPFPGVEYPNIMFRVCTKKERPPIPGNCPQEISILLQRCWQEDRRERPDVAEVIHIVCNYRLKVQAKYVNEGADLPSILPYTRINGKVGGSSTQLQVYHGTTIAGIKSMLPQTPMVSSAKMKAYHNELELDNNRTLSDYRIDDGFTVQFKPFIDLHVRNETGELVQCEVSPSETVAAVKQTIQQQTGTPCDTHHLIGRDTLLAIIGKFKKTRFSQEPLGKEKLSGELQVAAISDSTALSAVNALQLNDVLCLVDTRCVFELHELRGWSPHRTHLVVPSLTISDLKHIFGLVNYELPLYVKDQALDDDGKSLGFYGITHETTIEYRYW
ncbi:uncharacterized protein [Amphiura filiformis]|uniref:uncharacterized protein n=1 Tax=Amphiura filiformis TaxID=82378 RepID=UPI003B21C728